jgi:hypothetical protein
VDQPKVLMPDTGQPIAYAFDSLELPADRMLRHVVGWAAIVQAGQVIIRTALIVALATGSAATPEHMSWELGTASDQTLVAAYTLAMCALLMGGVLMLRRSRTSVFVIRLSIVCAVLMDVAILSMNLRESNYAMRWSTPAAAAMNTIDALEPHLPLFMIGLLTLPPLMKRAVFR